MNPGTWTCAALLVAVKIALVTCGLEWTLRLARRVSSRPAHQPDDNAVAVLAHRVAVAAAFFPGRALCLEQSVLLFVLLRRAAIDAQLCLGVRVRPFAAHAWIEVDGAPITDTRERLAHFARLPLAGRVP